MIGGTLVSSLNALRGREPDGTTRVAFGGAPRIDLNHERRGYQGIVFRRSRRDALALIGLFFFACAVLVPLTLHQRAVAARLHATERRLAEEEKRWAPVTQQSAAVDADLARWTRFEQSQSGRQPWRQIFPALAARTPPGILLDRVQIDARAEQRREATLQGAAASMTRLRAFLNALADPRRPDLFKNVRLAETHADTTLGPDGVRFKILIGL